MNNILTAFSKFVVNTFSDVAHRFAPVISTNLVLSERQSALLESHDIQQIIVEYHPQINSMISRISYGSGSHGGLPIINGAILSLSPLKIMRTSSGAFQITGYGEYADLSKEECQAAIRHIVDEATSSYSLKLDLQPIPQTSITGLMLF